MMLEGFTGFRNDPVGCMVSKGVMGGSCYSGILLGSCVMISTLELIQ